MVCSTVYAVCNKRNITVKANILQNPLFICECPSSQSRNKAKNALSLAKSISPEMAGTKIGKSFDSTIRSESKYLYARKKKQIL